MRYAMLDYRGMKTVFLPIVLVWSLMGTIHSSSNLLAADLTGGIKVIPVEPFDFVYPEASLKQQATDELEVNMARNEYEPVTFALLSDRAYENVTVEIAELKNAYGDKIKGDKIDIRVVKVWKQSGSGIWADKEVSVPELILTDDTATFHDSVVNNKYFPPSLPEVFKTSLVKGRNKQIWITIRTDPGSQPAGAYKGIVEIKSGGSLLRRIDLKINVLPIILPESAKQYFIYFTGRLNPPDHAEYLSKEDYLKQLRDIRNHGFRGITIFDKEEDAVRSALDMAKKEGFESAVVVMENHPMTARKIAALRAYGESRNMNLYFYGADEPYASDSKLAKHIELSRIIHQGGGRVVTAINAEAYELLMERGSTAYKNQPPGTFEPLDWPNYNLKLMQDRTKGGNSGKQKRSVLETYYWQIMQESPVMHRLYSGFYLWRSGMDGIFPYCYQYLLEQSSPYNNGDVYVKKNAKRKARAYLVAYPSKEGPVPTLQWEALREGVDDVRYLTALERLLEDAKPGAAAIHADINDMLSGYGYVGAVSSGVQPFRADTYRLTREKIVKHILELQDKAGSRAPRIGNAADGSFAK